jgi:hypothetical protein
VAREDVQPWMRGSPAGHHQAHVRERAALAAALAGEGDGASFSSRAFSSARTTFFELPLRRSPWPMSCGRVRREHAREGVS